MCKILSNCSCETIFTQDNILNDICLVVKKYAPFGKIAMICVENDTSYLDIVCALKKQGNKVVCLTFPTAVDFSTDSVCGLFTLHEDIRLIIASQNSSYFADYFATVRNIRSVVIAKDVDLTLYQSKIDIINGDSTDLFNVDCDKTIIVCSENFNSKNICALILELKFALFEYYVKTLFTKANFYKDGVIYILDLFNRTENIQGDSNNLHLAKNLCLALEFNFESGGEFLCFNSGYVCAKILNANLSVQKRLLIYKTILDKFEKRKKNSVLPPDYTNISEKISKVLHVKNCAKRMQDNLNNIKLEDCILEDFYKAFEIAKKYFTVELSTILNSKSKLTAKEISAIELAGYTFYGVNLCTIISEIDFIKE